MDSSITFTITLLGIFVIFELLKSNQNFSLLRLVILARLILLTSGSFLDYLFINGYEIPNYKEIYKAIAIILFINMLFFNCYEKSTKANNWSRNIFYTIFYTSDDIWLSNTFCYKRNTSE
jgi:hypothetical protein